MRATLTVLGSGTSMGVPTIGCDCAVCHSTDPHDRRTRPSILVQYGDKTVLIDTTPDFREQAIREQIRRLDAVLYTHSHADHILGIDYLRPLTFREEESDLASGVFGAVRGMNGVLSFRLSKQLPNSSGSCLRWIGCANDSA